MSRHNKDAKLIFIKIICSYVFILSVNNNIYWFCLKYITLELSKQSGKSIGKVKSYPTGTPVCLVIKITEEIKAWVFLGNLFLLSHLFQNSLSLFHIHKLIVQREHSTCFYKADVTSIYVNHNRRDYPTSQDAELTLKELSKKWKKKIMSCQEDRRWVKTDHLSLAGTLELRNL